jgi:hypothetical protein
MMCRCTILQCGQAKVRKSWPHMLGSIADNFIGASQAVHCGPWFCLSCMRLPHIGREYNTLSVTDRRDGAVMAQHDTSGRDTLANMAHFQDFRAATN